MKSRRRVMGNGQCASRAVDEGDSKQSSDTTPKRGNTKARSGSAKVRFHELASLFPEMSQKDYVALRDSIRLSGQTEPIWTHQDQVIDGRHRLKACEELDLEPRFQEWTGNGSLLEFVLAKNFARRNLNASQRAMLAAKLKPHLEAEARERLATSTGGARPRPRAKLPGAGGRSRDRAAATLGVSGRSTQDADRVYKRGVPELGALVEQGELSVADAAQIATLDGRQQRALVRSGPKACRKRAKSLREERKQTAKGRKSSRPESTAGAVRPADARPEDDPTRPSDAAECDDGRKARQEQRSWFAGLSVARGLSPPMALSVQRDALLWRRIRPHLEALQAAVVEELDGEAEDRPVWSRQRPLLLALSTLPTLSPPECWQACAGCQSEEVDGVGSRECPLCRGARFLIPDREPAV